MARCVSCLADVLESSTSCPACGSAVTPRPSLAPTVAMPLHGSPISPWRSTGPESASARVEKDRFPPGSVFADRYRILGMLGRGGMGEVYRATDLKLDQQVALKFLPEAAAADEAALARFFNEVRVARQVSHPNVCRVYDIGEVGGQPYISMEYIDGEDLGSLLRRIGRLPQDKAVEIARRLCAGLAAAHDKGVLHRDLKPANVMIDGRGQVLITDFGLAGLADQLQESEIRSGTPGYMAPEQLAGGGASVRSDIYSLGLVLYEIFTGKRAFEAASLAELTRLHQNSPPPSPASLVKDLDPAVERTILRCLAPDPRNRPSSALAVAAALPGGDPLAAALAAGETPSPDLVASSGEAGGLKVGIAALCLVFILAGLVIVAVLNGRIGTLGSTSLEYSPDTLAHKARDVIRQFGYTERPVDSASGMHYAGDYISWLKDHPAAMKWPVLEFWYRQSPRYLRSGEFLLQGTIEPSDPPSDVSGMATATLDPQGRLIRFKAVPPQVEKTPGVSKPVDPGVLFAAAGLDLARFTPADPQWIPPGAFDARAAWTGPYAGDPRSSVRVETASWRGRPVYLQVILPWSRADRMEASPLSGSDKAVLVSLLILCLSLLAGALVLARRNLSLGRADRRGAFRLAGFIFGIVMLVRLLLAHHIPSFGEVELLTTGVSFALFVTAVSWILYVALEPYVRRRWPQTMISWNRVLTGRFRDPLVGSDLLAGIVFGVAGTLLVVVRLLVRERLRADPSPLLMTDTLFGLRHAAALAIAYLGNSIGIALAIFLLIFLLRVLLRRQWLAALVFIALMSSLNALGSDEPLISGLLSAPLYLLYVIVLMRYGLVALVAGFVVMNMLITFPVTTDFSAFYADSSLFALLVTAGAAAYAFHAALAGRPLFRDELLQR